jgi:hypothetical protein
MAEEIQRPQELRINAWTGAMSPQQALPSRTPWAQMEKLAGKTQWLAAPVPADDRDWTHPEVGWGLVLPDNDGLPAAERARADDAVEPEAIRRLLQKRFNAPVLRWRKELQQGFLRRYYPDGTMQDLSAQAPNPGIGKGRIPRYLLIYATPSQIPWAVQYALNMSTFVGRLDPTGPGIARYIDALIDDWAGQTCDPRAPLVWSVDHGQNDITWLMARAVAGKIWQKIDSNTDLTKRRWLNDALATREQLGAALAERSPALVITTSHGMTGPLNDAEALKAQLGAPVDAQYAVLGSEQLGDWRPSGAIWYAHACCSAGSDAASRYKGLLPADGGIGSMLNGIADAAGATVAPLPRALLGAEKPLRAFIGHVEPTFDWTLRDPANKQVLTHVLCTALYDKLYMRYERNPIGWALQNVYKEAGNFYASWQEAVSEIDKNVAGMRDFALYRQLVAMDRQTLVILGDPTVSLPTVN